MHSETTTIESQHDGLKLSLSLIIPERPIGIVQLVHGMAEHRERYLPFMEFLSEHGFVTVIHDHRGHGDSVKSEEDYGYFYQDGARGLVDDAHQVTQYIRERFPDLPLTLFGHSMGSLTVRCYMQKYDKSVNGLVVCGSPSQRLGARTGRMVVKLMKLIKGERFRSKFVQKLAFGSYTKKFPDAKSENAWISSDPAVVEAFDADPRDGFIFTLNGFETLFTLILQTYKKSGWGMHNPEVPILFVAGEDDPCIVSQSDFEKAVNFMRERGYQNVRSKLYPGMRHEILNEIGKEAVWKDIEDWVRREVR